MVNIDDFVKRIEILLEYYGLNAASFADKIGVQRSSLSHLLSGRNKPSLDFVLKIVEVFPEIDLYWILIGKGNFLKSNNEICNLGTETTTEKTNLASLISDDSNNVKEKKEKIHSEKNADFQISNFSSGESEIEKIVFFYKNGTFKTFNP